MLVCSLHSPAEWVHVPFSHLYDVIPPFHYLESAMYCIVVFDVDDIQASSRLTQ